MKVYHYRFPGYNELGYDYYTGATNEEYFKSLLKYICKTYPDRYNLLIINHARPNSAGIYIMHIYNTNELKDGLSINSSILFKSLANQLVFVNTIDYVYSLKYLTF